MFILMVVLNFAILGVLIDFLVTKALIPTALRGTNWKPTWRAFAIVILLAAPALLIRIAITGCLSCVREAEGARF